MQSTNIFEVTVEWQEVYDTSRFHDRKYIGVWSLNQGHCDLVMRRFP